MAAASVSSSSSAADIKKTHVLLVDDCTITRMITSMLLSKNASCTGIICAIRVSSVFLQSVFLYSVFLEMLFGFSVSMEYIESALFT